MHFKVPCLRYARHDYQATYPSEFCIVHTWSSQSFGRRVSACKNSRMSPVATAAPAFSAAPRPDWLRTIRRIGMTAPGESLFIVGADPAPTIGDTPAIEAFAARRAAVASSATAATSSSSSGLRAAFTAVLMAIGRASTSVLAGIMTLIVVCEQHPLGTFGHREWKRQNIPGEFNHTSTFFGFFKISKESNIRETSVDQNPNLANPCVRDLRTNQIFVTIPSSDAIQPKWHNNAENTKREDNEHCEHYIQHKSSKRFQHCGPFVFYFASINDFGLYCIIYSSFNFEINERMYERSRRSSM